MWGGGARARSDGLTTPTATSRPAAVAADEASPWCVTLLSRLLLRNVSRWKLRLAPTSWDMKPSWWGGTGAGGTEGGGGMGKGDVGGRFEGQKAPGRKGMQLSRVTPGRKPRH